MIVINNMRDPYLEIDWRRCHLDLMKLQDRLTTASIKNEHNEIYKLQDQIIPKSVGGTNAMKNLAVLHRECHRQITQLTSNKRAAAKVVIL